MHDAARRGIAEQINGGSAARGEQQAQDLGTAKVRTSKVVVTQRSKPRWKSAARHSNNAMEVTGGRDTGALQDTLLLLEMQPHRRRHLIMGARYLL